MPAFEAGQRVLWHHGEATKHGPASVLRGSVVESLGQTDHPDGLHGQVGTVVDAANPEATWWRVDFGNGEQRVLTEDELVRVQPLVAEEGE